MPRPIIISIVQSVPEQRYAERVTLKLSKAYKDSLNNPLRCNEKAYQVISDFLFQRKGAPTSMEQVVEGTISLNDAFFHRFPTRLVLKGSASGEEIVLDLVADTSDNAKQETIKKIANIFEQIKSKCESYGYSKEKIAGLLGGIISIRADVLASRSFLLEAFSTQTGVRLRHDTQKEFFEIKLEIKKDDYSLNIKNEASHFDLVLGADRDKADDLQGSIRPNVQGMPEKESDRRDLILQTPDVLDAVVTTDITYQNGKFKMEGVILKIGDGLDRHIAKQQLSKKLKELDNDLERIAKKENRNLVIISAATSFFAATVLMGGGFASYALLVTAAVGLATIGAAWPLLVVGIGALLLAGAIIGIGLLVAKQHSQEIAAEIADINEQRKLIMAQLENIEQKIGGLKQQAADSARTVISRSASAASSSTSPATEAGDVVNTAGNTFSMSAPPPSSGGESGGDNDDLRPRSSSQRSSHAPG